MSLVGVEATIQNSEFDQFEVGNDVDDEAEAQSPDNWDNLHPINDTEARELNNVEETLEQIIEQNSREVAYGTDRDYRRLMAAFDRFLQKNHYIGKQESIFTMEPIVRTPLYIVAWVMEECDDMNPDGSLKLSHERRCTFTNAMKMRSAVTYGFGRLSARGNLRWQSLDGVKYFGNPSISTQVSRYMLALKKRKHASGELAMSSRAITSDIILKMFNFNNCPENMVPKPIVQTSRQAKDLADWGGPRARLLVHAIISLAFLCLLRSDEILNLRVGDIEFISTECISITLPSRKNSPFGSKPFRLFRFDIEEVHLCPIRALARWIKASGIENGYLFRNIDKMDRVLTEDKPLSQSTFLEFFRNNLIDVNEDPHAYGTHSLRRGGCQYLSKERRWSIHQICQWGGWSFDFSHLTIVRYLISWNDGLEEAREDFFNPKRGPALKCHHCGRSCWHA